jgi:hypothetical protein
MAATMTQVRDALAGQIVANVPGLNALARMVQVNPPAAVVEPERGETHDASLEGQLWHFKVTVLVSANDLEAAQNALDAYLTPGGDGSVQDAIEADATLGAVVDDATVIGWRDYQSYDVGDSTYLGVRFDVAVRP